MDILRREDVAAVAGPGCVFSLSFPLATPCAIMDASHVERKRLSWSGTGFVLEGGGMRGIYTAGVLVN